MDLEFQADQADLRDNVREVLTGICPPSVVRALYERAEPPIAVWEKMAELYWPALAIAEKLGGLGMGYLELAIVAEELGRACVPSPWLATVTQYAPAVRELGGTETGAVLLGAVAEGSVTGTLALAENGRWTADALGTTARATRVGDGWRLEGAKSAVLDGATADEIVVVARGDDGIGAFVVEGHSVRAQVRDVIDPTLPVADLDLGGVVVPADRVLAEPGGGHAEQALARVVEEAMVALAISTVGTCRVIFEQTLEYAKVREQYGKPIGSFQALKHRLADMFLSVERATSLCYFAALTIAEEDPRRAEAALLAKIAAGECQRLVVGEGLQLHGGIGYTWEHDLHFWLKRAKAGDALFGNSVAQRAALGARLGLIGPDPEVAA